MTITKLARNITLIASILLAITACDMRGLPQPAAIATLPASTGTAPLSIPTLVPFGTPVASGDWSFTCRGVKRYEFLPAKSGGGNMQPKNGEFAALLVDATSKGPGAVQLELDDFSLTDGQGRIYRPDMAASLDYDDVKDKLDPVGEQFEPGALHRFGIVFDVPKADHELVLVIFNTVRLDVGAYGR